MWNTFSFSVNCDPGPSETGVSLRCGKRDLPRQSAYTRRGHVFSINQCVDELEGGEDPKRMCRKKRSLRVKWEKNEINISVAMLNIITSNLWFINGWYAGEIYIYGVVCWGSGYLWGGMLGESGHIPCIFVLFLIRYYIYTVNGWLQCVPSETIFINKI